jgi:pimeloyl-ACP methyl ester carboxylesterase
VVLVPGAWHPASAFSPLTKALEADGLEVVPVDLVSVGADPPLSDFKPDVTRIASKLTELADAGKDIILLMHSYGGVPGSSATEGIVKSVREKAGKSGGVVHLIYCTAFALPAGGALMDAVGGNPLPWFKFNNPELDHKEYKEKLTVMPDGAKDVFYNEVKDEDVVKQLVGSLKPHSYSVFWSPVTYAGWTDCPAT